MQASVWFFGEKEAGEAGSVWEVRSYWHNQEVPTPQKNREISCIGWRRWMMNSSGTVYILRIKSRRYRYEISQNSVDTVIILVSYYVIKYNPCLIVQYIFVTIFDCVWQGPKISNNLLHISKLAVNFWRNYYYKISLKAAEFKTMWTFLEYNVLKSFL